ncbi:MAG: acetamidase/formamidase family protein [Lyngbya sp. HA4199-MV5]|jgi:acetamidase/formamidase|nr:acetamidase/formamidase family protein [Lyngbya sp. HA4199-MV5]
MAHHLLKATCETVHFGGFSPDLPPALTIDSGDVIDVETYSGYNIWEQAPKAFLPPEFLEICHKLPAERRVGGGPHLLTGPIFIRDAEPGDVLEITLHSVQPSVPVGFNAIRPGWGALTDRFGEGHLRFIHLDLDKNLAEFPEGSGIQIPIRPFFGILGVATAATRNSIPPGAYGGNIDNPELQAGSRVFLPVFLPGALFSIGDGHSAQGDGEVCGTAIETSMNGTVELILRKDMRLNGPIAETLTDFITTGFATTLDDALQLALHNMVDFLKVYAGITETEAYCLCSLAVNFRITQVVNSPQKGVHGLLPKALFKREIRL